MFDDFSKRSKAIRAALDLAEQRGWRHVTLLDIAQAAGISLSDLRREFTSKNDIIRAFQQEVDAEVLAKARPTVETQSPRSFPAAISSITLGMPDQPAWISPVRIPFTIAEPPR